VFRLKYISAGPLATPELATEQAFKEIIHFAEISRNNLRDAEIESIESDRKNYQTSVYYMDIVNKLEKMGDFIINISQDLERGFVTKSAV
jgi:Na+/phosphate symporter